MRRSANSLTVGVDTDAHPDSRRPSPVARISHTEGHRLGPQRHPNEFRYHERVKRPTPVLVANAPLSWTPCLTALAAGGHPLLAADGGANHLARIGLRPEAVIGDLDSLLPGTRAWLGEKALVERPDQDRTDLDKALEHALVELALPRLKVLAATAGRIDHTVAHLGLLPRLRRGCHLVFVDAEEEMLPIDGPL